MKFNPLIYKFCLFRYIVYWNCQLVIIFFISFCVTEEDIDELNVHVVRYRPEELTKLTKITKFNKKEIQLIYRGFKQVKIYIFFVEFGC